MLHLQLLEERRMSLTRDSLKTQMWKNINVIFSCVSLDIEIPQLKIRDYMEFSMLNESGMVRYPSRNLTPTWTLPSLRVPDWSAIPPPLLLVYFRRILFLTFQFPKFL